MFAREQFLKMYKKRQNTFRIYEIHDFGAPYMYKKKKQD